MLSFRKSESLEIVRYSYVDYANYMDDHKSTSSYVFMMRGGAISWKSVKETLTATSTMEAEYIACYETTCQVVWLRKLISGMYIIESISRPLTINCDDSFVVFFTQNQRNSNCTKHFDVKLLFVREKIVES